MAVLSFRELAALATRHNRAGRILSEKLAENYESVKKFPVRIHPGVDDCTGFVHHARFLRGYVGNSQELWLQARRTWGMSGLDPISNYETVSIGLNGYISHKVWSEVHSPSSKTLSIRLLSDAARKAAWHDSEKGTEVREFESIQDFRMAVVALNTCISKVMPWNSAFTALTVFLQSINFGEHDLADKPDKLSFLADFVDEVLRHNAQAWDEERHFMGAQEISAKWSALFLRKFSAAQASRAAGGGPGNKAAQKGGKKPLSKEERVPPGLCKPFQTKQCPHPGEKHLAPWDKDYVLCHQCGRWLNDKRRYCMGNHARSEHK